MSAALVAVNDVPPPRKFLDKTWGGHRGLLRAFLPGLRLCSCVLCRNEMELPKEILSTILYQCSVLDLVRARVVCRLFKSVRNYFAPHFSL